MAEKELNFNSHAYLVVMAGGSGTRFWPKSTSKKPKQLLPFGKSDTLLSQTLSRFDGLVSPKKRMIVTTRTIGQSVRDMVSDEVIVLTEPQARNTAPCVYWAAREVYARDRDGIMLVMPSDHFIPGRSSFLETLSHAISHAWVSDDLITLGVKPTRPETGYGYLRTGERLSESSLRVEAFVEKPSLEKAESFLREENYLWNGGMFVWKASAILKAFDSHMSEMKKIWEECSGKIEDAYPRLTATSIDYGIMEKASNVVTYPIDCGWDDLGSWTSLETLSGELGMDHPAGSVNAAECISVSSKHNIVDAPTQVVALLGVSDLVIVQTGNVLMVADKNRAQEIKQLVDAVKAVRPDLV